MFLAHGLLFIYHHGLLILAGILGLGFIIASHEFGHFIFCKIFNIHTPSFSIGFGPKLFSKKIGETEFSLSAIPIGGYVEIAGLVEMGQGEQKDAHSKDSRSFDVKPWYQKLLVLFGGIMFNLIFAYLVFIFLFATGLPKTEFLYPLNAQPVIEKIAPELAEKGVDLQVGDRVLALNGTPIHNDTLSLLKQIKTMPGQDVILTLEREGQEREAVVTLETRPVMGKQVGSLNVLFQMSNGQGHGFGQSIIRGIDLTNKFIMSGFMLLKYIFVQRSLEGTGGPLFIISETMKSAGQGSKIFLLFLAMISVSIAVFNLLPLPILDGGQILFVTIEAIIRRPLPLKVREYIHIASWLLMILLILVLTIRDFNRMAAPLLKKIAAFFGWGK